MQSCASAPVHIVSNPCGDCALSPAGLIPSDSSVFTLVGRLRIDVAQYRLRGLCRMTYANDGSLRIDFHHSSLFGAIEEDATLIMRDSLVMYDIEGRRMFDADSSLALLRECAGAAIEPDDIAHALLLRMPQCRDLEGPRCARKGAKWTIEALWRGRRVEWDGEDRSGVMAMRQCFSGGAPCYSIEYTYGKDAASAAYPKYPKRIRLQKIGGAERLTLEVSEAGRAAIDRSVFDVARAPDGRRGEDRPAGGR